MTCYWNAILATLNKHEKEVLGVTSNTPMVLARQLQIRNNNVKINNIIWNGKLLSKQELLEHQKAIKEYNLKGIYNGHLCGTCDSFLILLSFILGWEIHHRYLKYNIYYKNKCITKRRVFFKSNRGHFYI